MAKYTKEEGISNLLDFNTPNVGYEDQEGRDVCGCCGTYYVVDIGDANYLKEVVTELYEALKRIMEGQVIEGDRILERSMPTHSAIFEAQKVLAKVESNNEGT